MMLARRLQHLGAFPMSGTAEGRCSKLFCVRKLVAFLLFVAVGSRLLLSELFGVVSALRRNASQTVAATDMAAIRKQNQIFTPIVGVTPGSREGTLVLPRRSSGLSGTPNSSQTLRHIAIKATG
jgi:hypothetical protein